MTVLYGIILIVCSYLIGNLNFAYIFMKAVRHEDIRDYGSGNAGTTNILRTLGIKYAAPVFILDAIKGAICIIAARLMVSYLGINEFFVAFAGIAVLCGHNWPVFLQFRGGKGSATSVGIFFALDPLVAVIVLAFGAIILALFKMVSLMSILCVIAAPITILIMQLIQTGSVAFTPELLLAIFMCCSSVFQHRSNIKRILAGTESKIGQKVKLKDDSEQK